MTSAEGPSATQTVPDASTAPARVLVVDDEPRMRELMSELLSTLQVQTTVAPTVEQAMDLLVQGEVFDLFVLDIRIGGGNGLVLARQIRKHPSGATRPIIFVSGHFSQEELRKVQQTFTSAVAIPKLALGKKFLPVVAHVLEKTTAKREPGEEKEAEEPAATAAGEKTEQLPAAAPNAGQSQPGEDPDESEEEELVLSGAMESDGRDTPGLIGEFDESDIRDDDPGPSRRTEGVDWKLPPALTEAAKARVTIFEQIDDLDQERKKRLEHDALHGTAVSEYRRQAREAQQLPDARTAKASLGRLLDRLTRNRTEVELEQAEPLPESLVAAYELAIRQWRLCMEREMLMEKIVEASRPLTAGEPVYRLLTGRGVDVDRLFGIAIYALVLDELLAEEVKRSKSLRQQTTTVDLKRQSFFGKLRKISEEEQREHDSVASERQRCARRLSALQRESGSLEPSMLKWFWEVYEQAALLLLQEDLHSGQEGKVLRAFLRFGLLGTEPWFMPAETVAQVLAECENVIETWDNSPSATHVLYADEYLRFAAAGKITPSFDEDLELNHRNSPAWVADRAWRRIVHTQVVETTLESVSASLQQDIDRLRAEKKEYEQQRDALLGAATEGKARRREAEQHIQLRRVKSARFERAVTRIEEELLPRLVDSCEQAQEKLAGSGHAIQPDAIIRREVAGIHRVTRLVVNLKERFLPFSLRDGYRPETGVVNSRDAVLEQIQAIEERDPVIFKEPLFRVKKKVHRIDLRYSPVVLIAPGYGFLGYAWNPRQGPEVGRLVVPAYVGRSRGNERMFWDLFSDFRWDTDKASAGVDAMTSHTICAAYANVRWDYRKRKKETREKAGFRTTENDRKNWRRHYGFYMESAMDGGRRLFFKCNDVYEQVVIKHFDLPEGVERLRR